MGLKVLSDLVVGNVKFPAADGSNGQVLRTDGSGNLHFATMSNSDTKLSGLSFNTGSGVLTATLSDSNTVTVDLDGRYAAAAHTHDYDNYSSWNLKTNGTQRTTVQSGGTLDLVAGSNVALSYGAGGKVTISSTDTNTNSEDYLNSASFNTSNGVLSLSGVGRASASVDLDGRYLALSGGNMSGLITFKTSSTNNGFLWNVNSDLAGINFKNTGDGDTNSNLNFFTKDNGNEYFKFSHTHYQSGHKDYVDIKDGAVRVNGNLYVNANQSGDVVDGTNTLTNGNRVWHTGDFANNSSNWNTAYGWGNHASAGYTGNIGTITGISTGVGLDGTATSGAVAITLDLSELTDMTAAVAPTVDEIILLDNGAERRKRFSEIFGSAAYQNTSAFDSAGSADAVNQRIDTEVLPAIPTNNNELANGAGYITDGNSGWNNSYGFITSSSTNTLTNKSGNISQWTNDAGYITDGNSGWNNSYGFITASSTNTLTNKSGNISQWTNNSGYLTEETITRLTISGNILTYRNEAGEEAEIDLGLYLDDSNLARLTSGTLNSATGIATFKRDDNSTFTVDFSALFDNVNNYADSLSFNTSNGILTLGRNGSLADLTVDLDGRFQGAGNYFTDGDTVLNMANNDGLVYDDVNNRMYVKLDGTNREIFHTGNFTPSNYLSTSGKAADSNLLDGLDLGGTRANVANKVVRTDSSGYLQTGWINTTSGNTTSTITDFYVNTNDGYIRKATKAHVKSQLGLGSAAYVATSAFDAAGTGAAAAAAVDQRIDEEVLPAIPTNNNELTNGAGYITSANGGNANLLDGIDSGSFLRSDATDYLNATLYLRGDVVNSGNGYRDHGVFGTYDSYKTDHIWSMGAAYRNNKDGVDFGNLYGLAYKHTNNTTGGTMAGGHQMVWTTSGNPKAALGDDGVWTSGHGTSANWKQAYDNYITGAAFSGTSTKTLTLTQRDGGKITATFADRDTNTWRGIDDVPVNGQTGESISSNWAYDHANANNPHGISLSSLGFTGATNANYITNNTQISNGRGYLTSSNDRVYITDSRGGFRLPSYYNDRYAQFDFQNTSDTGAGGDSWHALLTVSKWSSFDPSHSQEQLIFTGDNLKRRTAVSDSEWGDVKTIWDTGNLNALTNATVSNDTITFTKADGSTFAVTTSDANTNTWRGIHDSPVNGATTTSISSNWAFDNVKTAVPAGAVFTDTNTNTTYTAGGGLTLSGTKFSHTDTSSQGSVNNSGRTYIQDITLDTYGHITGITSATETVVNTDTNTQRSNADIREVTSNQLVEGDNVTLSVEGDTIVISSRDTNTNTQLSTAQVRAKFSGNGINTSTGVITDTNTQLTTAQVRSKFTAGANVSISSTGVISATDTNTDTNTQRSDSEIRAVTKKQLLDGDNITFVSEGDNIIINAKDTNTNTTYSAGTGLTLSGTSFSLTNTYDNYNGWDLYTNGTSRGRITSGENVNFAAGSNVSLSYSSTNNTITINSTDTNTDTNTTYSADGNYGMTLSGTAFRLEDDRRRNSTTTDIYTGNTHDYTFYDASVGIRWYTAGSEDMRLYDNGTLHVDGDIIAYSTTISDARLKDDVVTITNAVDKIKALRGVEYTWNAGTRKDKRDLGLIAQEVEEVLPEIVHEHDMPLMEGAEENETYKTVDYEKIVGVLIEGMKEQQAEIDLLKAEVKVLKQK